jgi:S-DNA-T family DNA segregation ATPase FtsK/SpoIIIE
MSLDTGDQLGLDPRVVQSWLGSGPARLHQLMARAAPGCAGAPNSWARGFGDVPATGFVPQLCRIGAGYLPTAQSWTFPVGVPLLDRSHLYIDSSSNTRSIAETLVETLLLRVVRYFRPGLVRLHVWDAAQFAGRLPGLYPLTTAGLLTVHKPTQLKGLLEGLAEYSSRVHTGVLATGYPSLAAHAADTGERVEPWTVVALLGTNSDIERKDPTGVQLDRRDVNALQAVLSSGPAAGISVVLLDLDLPITGPHERLEFADVGDPDGGGWTLHSSMTGQHALVVPDAPLPPIEVTTTCAAIANEYERQQNKVGSFDDLLPPAGEWGQETSERGLITPVGFAGERLVNLRLGDATPHALIGGPSGSGKTNLIFNWLASLCTRFSPEELELYLLDFKESVSFNLFAPGQGSTGLPHARLVGVNVNTDPEFGLALLEHLSEEMKRRAIAAKGCQGTKVTDIEGLRAADPEGRWPRIVAVIDEAQIPLSGDRDVARRMATELDDVARRGRSFGIHVVLASQDVSGIQVLWDRPAILQQFRLRIALPTAAKVLATGNDAANTLPPHNAIVNHDSGVSHGNEQVRLTRASTELVEEVQRALQSQYATTSSPPRVFDGDLTPTTAELVAALPTEGGPYAALGRRFDVQGRAALVAMDEAAGRNIGIISATAAPAVRVLDAAVASLAASHRQRVAKFIFATLVRNVGPTSLPVDHETEVVEYAKFRALLAGLLEEVEARLNGRDGPPTYLVAYGMDSGALDKSGVEALRAVIRLGPRVGVHVLGWCASPTRLKDLLQSARDDIGVMLGLDVQGSDFATLISARSLLDFSPQADRGWLFDRAQHSQPVKIITPGVQE